MITREMIGDAINILDDFHNTDEECFADESVVSFLMDTYNLDIADAHSCLATASGLHGAMSHAYC